MLILKKVSNTTPGKDIKVTVMGEEVTLTIRPLNADITEALRKRFKKEDAFTDALTDHVLESFDGVADETGPLPVNLDTKKQVMSIPSIDGGQSVAEVVFNEAKKLAYEVQEEELKNS